MKHSGMVLARIALNFEQRLDSHLCGSSPLINSAIERGAVSAQHGDHSHSRENE